MIEYHCDHCDNRWTLTEPPELVVWCPECDTRNDGCFAQGRAEGISRYSGDTDTFATVDGFVDGQNEYSIEIKDDGAATPHYSDSVVRFPYTDRDGDTERLGPDDYDGRDGKTRKELVEELCGLFPGESDKEADDEDGGMGADHVGCGVDGCNKEAIADVLDADAIRGESGKRCLGCLEYHLREHHWGGRAW